MLAHAGLLVLFAVFSQASLDYSSLLTQAKTIQPQLIEHRRHLHQEPELLYELHNTSAYVRQQLDELGIPYRQVQAYADTRVQIYAAAANRPGERFCSAGHVRSGTCAKMSRSAWKHSSKLSTLCIGATAPVHQQLTACHSNAGIQWQELVLWRPLARASQWWGCGATWMRCPYRSSQARHTSALAGLVLC